MFLYKVCCCYHDTKPEDDPALIIGDNNPKSQISNKSSSRDQVPALYQSEIINMPMNMRAMNLLHHIHDETASEIDTPIFGNTPHTLPRHRSKRKAKNPKTRGKKSHISKGRKRNREVTFSSFT